MGVEPLTIKFPHNFLATFPTSSFVINQCIQLYIYVNFRIQTLSNDYCYCDHYYYGMNEFVLLQLDELQ